jgi:hypothetical protein
VTLTHFRLQVKDSIKGCGTTRRITHTCSGPSFACSKLVYTGTGRSAIGLDATGKRRNLALRIGRSMRRESSTRRVIAGDNPNSCVHPHVTLGPKRLPDTLSIHLSHGAQRDIWGPSLGSTEGTQTAVGNSESPEFETEFQHRTRVVPALRLDLRAKMPSTNKPGAQPLPPCPESFPAGSDAWKTFQACKTLESTERWLVFHVDLAHPRPEEILLGFTPACAGRVLGFALLYSPSDGGREALTAEILGRGGDHELLAGLAHLVCLRSHQSLCVVRCCLHVLPSTVYKPETDTHYLA